MIKSLSDKVEFPRGPAMKNRMALAPLTNLQSNPDGTASKMDERWLRMRAEGGFGMVMTCAAYTQEEGKGYYGQLGAASEQHLEGLERLAAIVNRNDVVSSLQLMHAGMRVEERVLVGSRLGAYDDKKSGTRALTTGEVEGVVESFIKAAALGEEAGFHGVQLHGAHGYLLCSFLNAERNRRNDRFGGSFINRSRIFLEIIDGIRAETGADFQLGIRLSPDRYGIPLDESRKFSSQLMNDGKVDYIDMSLWNVFNEPVEEQYTGTELIDHFVSIDRGDAVLSVAGQIPDAPTAKACVDRGADIVMIGRGAILRHDFAHRALADPEYPGVSLPVTRDYLDGEGLGEPFINYLATSWKNFVME